MRHARIKVFDDFIPSTSVVTTRIELADDLGRHDKLAVEAVIDQHDAGGALTIQAEHSANGRNWVAKPGSPLINAVSISAGGTRAVVGYDDGSNPSLGLVRLAIQLGGGMTSAHVELYAVPRDHR